MNKSEILEIIERLKEIYELFEVYENNIGNINPEQLKILESDALNCLRKVREAKNAVKKRPANLD